MITFSNQLIHFMTSLEGSQCGVGESIPFSQKNVRIFKKYLGINLNTSRLLCFMLTWSRALFLFCSSFSLQSLAFCYSVFWDFDCWLCRFLPQSYCTLCLASWAYWEWTFYACRNFSTHEIYSHEIFTPIHPCAHKTLTVKTNCWLQPWCI